MSFTQIGILLFIVAFVVTLAVYPFVLGFARRHHIVDNPDARKLQRFPVPVMGGTAVFAGILFATFVATFFFSFELLGPCLLAMAFMYVVGTWDDISELRAQTRFLLEIILVWGIIISTRHYIDHFFGLWHLNVMSGVYGVPLSILAGVGIINAVNLIDGVDGYSPAFGMMACSCFAYCFYAAGDTTMGSLSIICAGALMPFFLHNVFGRRSKMFIGDGGTLMLGTAMTIFVFNVLSTEGHCAHFEKDGMGLIPFALAVMSVPVFDTLRVMSTRMYRGLSPFHADRTHLHHLYIEMGFSHVGAAISIVTTNLLTVMLWLLSWKLGASIDTQFYIVVFLSFMSTFGFYWFIKWNKKHDTPFYAFCCRMGEHTHLERKGSWLFIQRMVDMNVFGIGKKTE